MIKTYPEAVQYLYDNLPIFQRVGAVAYKKDITNTIKLCDALGNPQDKFRSLHVAGTNGKGSSSHMLASILQEAGYKTGLYTSPHLKSFTERIKINGKDIDEGFVIEFVNKIKPLIDTVEPSFFEITVAMAFDYFAQHAVDAAVIEVGLGGRLDSTNVITPVVSLITNIGWDHKDILGDTLLMIASEKAGIIKRGVPVVISERQPEVEDVFKTTATGKEAPLFFASADYKVSAGKNNTLEVQQHGKDFLSALNLPLRGLYQHKNLPGVLKTVELMNTMGFEISKSKLQSGLERVVSNTKLKGRWQKINDKPLVICDTGHNIDGIKEVVRQIKSIQYNKLHIVLGMVKDKDIKDILAQMPMQATYYFCQAKIPRALDAQTLSEKAGSVGLKGEVIPDVNEAKKRALKNASPDDFIFIGGSTFVVAEIEEL